MWRLVIGIALVGALLGAQAQDAAAVAQAHAAALKDQDTLRIGFVTDVGELFDDSFNEGVFEGVVAAASELTAMGYRVVAGPDQGAVIVTPLGSSSVVFLEEFASFAQAGFDFVVATGFLSVNEVRLAAERFPGTFFIGIDQGHEGLPNLQGVLYPEDQRGFLAGAFAASLSQSGTVGVVYGPPIPPVALFDTGFQAGVRFAQPEVRVLTVFASSFTDPEFGTRTAAAMIDQGADLIVGAGGITGNGAIEEACGRGVRVMGVDVDQFFSLPSVQPCIVTSAIKGLSRAAQDAIVYPVLSGTFQSGTVFGTVGLAPFHNFEGLLPQAALDTVARAQAGLADGSITIP
ncbi:MAG: BMP family ABC transporter substrate-binding protein [Deinococcus sp.]|nr:BMP family ABC transporter substrate-binding protein [Deinococcus sp.]